MTFGQARGRWKYLSKPERVDVGIVQAGPQPHRFAGRRADIRAIVPADQALDLVGEHLRTVVQSIAGQAVAFFVLDLPDVAHRHVDHSPTSALSAVMLSV